MTAADYGPRPAGCCGKCPPILAGGYDCTCEGNPRCVNTIRAERRALAARLAAVEALLEWAETNPHRPYVITGEQVPHAIEARQLRAALSASPTDTTKEN